MTQRPLDEARVEGRVSTPELLVLHAVRLHGVTDDDKVARRAGLPRELVSELLLDAEAFGCVTRVEFGATKGWALTDRGRAQDRRALADELEATQARATVEEQHRRFEELNGRLVRASTDWQLRPTPSDRFAANLHDDPEWDARILRELADLHRELGPLVAALAAELARFAGYDDRFGAALARATGGASEWVTGIDVDSCHAVWMELHEDLLSTLGLARAEMGTRYLYLARHGMADAFGALTDDGRRQADLLGARLADQPITAIWHSPLPRAAASAEILARHLPGVPVAVAPELVDHMPYVPTAHEMPRAWAGFFNGFDDGSDEAVEGRRLADALAARFARSSEEDTHELLVTHAYPIAWLLRDAMGAPPDRWLGLSGVANTGLSLVAYGPDAPPTVVLVNDLGHLPADLRWTGFAPGVRP